MQGGVEGHSVPMDGCVCVCGEGGTRVRATRPGLRGGGGDSGGTGYSQECEVFL